MASKNVIITNGSASETLYNADKIEEKLATGRAITGNSSVSGNLTVGGTTTLTGGISGDLKVTALTSDSAEISAKKPVVEVMAGYSLTNETKANITNTPLYQGICKNGNKLTIVLFSKLNRSGSVDYDYYNSNTITIPYSLGIKLVPYYLAGGNTSLLFNGKFSAFKDGTDAKEVFFTISKSSDTLLRANFYGINTLDLNTDYIVRAEVTFLLSENLAS